MIQNLHLDIYQTLASQSIHYSLPTKYQSLVEHGTPCVVQIHKESHLWKLVVDTSGTNICRRDPSQIQQGLKTLMQLLSIQEKSVSINEDWLYKYYCSLNYGWKISEKRKCYKTKMSGLCSSKLFKCSKHPSPNYFIMVQRFDFIYTTNNIVFVSILN